MSNHKGKQVIEGSSTCRLKSICVLGGKVFGKDNKYLLAAYDLGQALAFRGINLVYGGGNRGLRGYVAAISLIWGSEVLSVNLQKPDDKNTDDFTIGTELKVSNLPEKLRHMSSNTEAFIALPGDFETLSEISNIIFWSDLNLHKKPLGLLNTNGFYDNWLAFLDHAVEQDIITQATRRTILSASTVDQLINQLQAYTSNSSSSMG